MIRCGLTLLKRRRGDSCEALGWLGWLWLSVQGFIVLLRKAVSVVSVLFLLGA